MKKIFSNNRIIAFAFLTMFSIGAVSVAAANDNKQVPAELKYIGNIKNHQLFQLTVAGDASLDDYSVRIFDEYGQVVYHENIKAGVFTKKFLFDADELRDSNLKFEVYCKKTRKSVVYEINQNTRQVVEMVVNEVK